MSKSPSIEQRSHGRPHRLGRFLAGILIGVVVAGMATWATLFLWFSNVPWAPVRAVLAGLFALGTIASFIAFRRRGRTLLVFLLAFAIIVGWYFSIRPSNDREWAPEVAVLSTATIDGNLVTVRNVRNFDYRSETDFTPRYDDKTYDLDKLRGVDLVCVYWGNPSIAHVMASFGFEGGDHLAFSIEMRKEAGEPGSMLQSFFRHYELIYVAADERDVIRVRTNFREPREQVHVYRTRLPVENQRKLFLSYIDKMNELSVTPEWYNALQDNCTTGVLSRTHAYKGRARYNWKVLLSGFAAEYAYEIGLLDTSTPFAELEKRSLVNELAEAAGEADDFSERIRRDIPRPKPYTMEEFMSSP